MALGWFPMCQQRHKNRAAVLTLPCSGTINTYISHSECGIKPSLLNTENELITRCLNCKHRNHPRPRVIRENETPTHVGGDTTNEMIREGSLQRETRRRRTLVTTLLWTGRCSNRRYRWTKSTPPETLEWTSTTGKQFTDPALWTVLN